MQQGNKTSIKEINYNRSKNVLDFSTQIGYVININNGDKMKIGDLVKHNRKRLIGVVTKHQMLNYYMVLWSDGKVQHSVKSSDLEVIA